MDAARFMGCLLAKVGLDCVARGLDVDGGRERDADHASSREARERCHLLRDVGGHRREERPVRGDRDADRGAEVDAEQRPRDLEAGRPAAAPGRERPVGPRELEVLGDRGGLAGVGEQLRQRGRMLGRAQRAVGEVARRGAADELRRGRPRVEVREQELGGLPEARERELVVGRGQAAARPRGAARPLTASPAPAAERRRLRRFIPGVRSLSLPMPQEHPGRRKLTTSAQ